MWAFRVPSAQYPADAPTRPTRRWQEVQAMQCAGFSQEAWQWPASAPWCWYPRVGRARPHVLAGSWCSVGSRPPAAWACPCAAAVYRLKEQALAACPPPSPEDAGAQAVYRLKEQALAACRRCLPPEGAGDGALACRKFARVALHARCAFRSVSARVCANGSRASAIEVFPELHFCMPASAANSITHWLVMCDAFHED